MFFKFSSFDCVLYVLYIPLTNTSALGSYVLWLRQLGQGQLGQGYKKSIYIEKAYISSVTQFDCL